jgi:hypothetical protein
LKTTPLRALAVVTAIVLTLIAVPTSLLIINAIAAPAPITITTAYTTAYTWFDNTPPGSGTICCPQLHPTAGGTGTYADPITIAVGHSTATGVDVLDYPAGTRFYNYDVRRYFIVEDACGGSSPPQSGGCHSLANAPAGATTWVDMWAGGTAADSQAAAQACASKLTDGDGALHTIVEYPPAGLPVVAGPLFQNGQCTALYGNAAPPPGSTPTPPSTPAPIATPTPAVVPAPPPAGARYDFEDGTPQTWQVAWGSTLSVANSTLVAFQGTHSLQVHLNGTADYPAVDEETDLSGLAPGVVIVYRVYSPSASAVGVQPFVFDGSWSPKFGSSVGLAAGWNTVSYTVPAGVTAFKGVGMQINNGSGFAGNIYLDAITWGAAPPPGPSPTPTSTGTPVPTPVPTPPSQPPTAPNFDHVVVVLMENTSYGSIIGNTAQAPYINSLAKTYAYSSNYFATDHPSLPNYLEMTSGTNAGIIDDCTPPGVGCTANVSNIADRVAASGRTWKGYMEDAPSSCPTRNSGFYYTKHDPFVYYDNIRNNAARCANIVPYTKMAADFATTGTAPNFAFVTPNQCNDMHDCSIATGDNWLKQNMGTILNSPAFTQQNSLLVIVWDEDDSSGNNHVAAIMAGSSVKRGYVSGALANHYSLLRTIEAAWGLPTLTGNDAGASVMSDLFIAASPPPSPSPSATPRPTPTPTPTPTATPTPAPTPTSRPITGVPCTVTLPDGTQHTGTCSGTFTGL